MSVVLYSGCGVGQWLWYWTMTVVLVGAMALERAAGEPLFPLVTSLVKKYY